MRPPRPMATACSKLSGQWLGCMPDMCPGCAAGGCCMPGGIGMWELPSMCGPRVGEAFSFGKLMLAGLSCRVDGLLGVGGKRRRCSRLVASTG